MIDYKHDLIKNAQKLRRNATPQENKLWYEFLRTYPIRFQRQKAINCFIVDFYCYKAKLIIEIDGSQHYYGHNISLDSKRTEKLNSIGLEVLRFSNYDINNYFDAVCNKIDYIVHKRLQENK
ncbi:MAG TPA: endonuclease domain-containing protein [Oscillospiraceae bacterium]|nr:endonuclease domain-containing protein [Oscillospiraceae bacterium]